MADKAPDPTPPSNPPPRPSLPPVPKVPPPPPASATKATPLSAVSPSISLPPPPSTGAVAPLPSRTVLPAPAPTATPSPLPPPPSGAARPPPPPSDKTAAAFPASPSVLTIPASTANTVPLSPPPSGAALPPLPPPPAPASKPAPAKDSPKSGGGKAPLPLLSRTKLRQPRDIPATPGQGPAIGRTGSLKPPRKRSIIGAIAARLAAYGILIGLGYGAVHLLRQTQVQGLVATPDYALPSQAYLIRDFSDDIRTLRTEYKLSNEPFERDLRVKQDTLTRVQSDLSGLEQRKKLIADDAARAEDEIKGILADAQLQSDAVWQKEGGALDAEYQQKLSAFRQTLEDRAKQTGVPLELDPAIDAPELWVNAYRLALYNPPAKVKAVPEREWIEKQLSDWHDYDKTVDTRRDAVKAEAAAVRKEISPKVDAVQARITKDNSDIEDTDVTAEPLRTELAADQVEADQAQQRLVAQRTTFTSQLLDIPKRNILETFPLTTQGRFSWQNLNQDSKYPPGSYFLWASIKKDGQEYWALVPFTVTAYSRLDLVIEPGAFVPALGLLK